VKGFIHMIVRRFRFVKLKVNRISQCSRLDANDLVENLT